MGAASHLCRLCARSRDDLVGVFSEEGHLRRILEKIHTHLPVQITAEDCMPTSVCEECSNSLEISHNLLKFCLEADSKLRQILNLPEDPSYLAALAELKQNVGFSSDQHLFNQVNVDNQSKNNTLNATFSGETVELVNNSDVQEVFQCQSCSKEFNNADVLLQHRNEDHGPEEQYSCTICGEFSSNFVLYIDHLCIHFKDRDDTIWECGNCGLNISSVESLKLHMSEDCKVEPQPDGAPEHSSPCQSSKIECAVRTSLLSCSKCSAEYQCKEELNLHMKSHNIHSKDSRKPSTSGKRRVECRVCGKSFESFWYMARHRNEDHSKEEVARALRRHGLDREKFECSVCGKLLASRFSFKHHLQAHEGVRNYQCPQCSRSFVYLAQLKSHMLFHNSNPHICPVCSKQYPNDFALRVHLRTHTGERPFPCEHCPKAFHSRANYEQHVIIHSDKRKYQCHLCTYRAKRLEALQSHIRVHTNERPYTCKVCGKGFKQKNDCTKHERLHAKWPPGASIRPGVARYTHKKSENSSTVDDLAVDEDEPNPLSDLLGDEGSSNASSVPLDAQATDQNSAANKLESTAVMSLSDETIPMQKVQQILVAFEEASDQCSVFWSTP